jgi:hypothetical protein
MKTGARMSDATTPGRWWLYGCDPREPADRMVIDLVRGIPRENCPAVITPDDIALWESMKPGITAAIDQGRIVEPVSKLAGRPQ